MEKGKYDSWVIFDRHPLSSAIIFPLLHVKSGYMSPQDFLSLAVHFKANQGDLVCMLSMSQHDNIRMLKKRGREEETSITPQYVKRVNSVFESVYYSWLLLQHFSPEDITSVCCGDVTISKLCTAEKMSETSSDNARRLFSRSMFLVLKDMIEGVRFNCTITEIVLSLCIELKKLQMVVVNGSEYLDDFEGLWGNIYAQVMRNHDIKTQVVDWEGLKTFSSSFK